jgi:hypothetical protein
MSDNGQISEEILKERMIFRYHDGERVRYADPIVLQIKLEEEALEWEEFVNLQQKMEQTGQADMAALSKMISIGRKVFDIQEVHEVDGKLVGKTLLEVLDILADFMLFIASLKKMDESSPTLQKFTELESSLTSKKTPQPERKEASVTEPSASSGSTENEANTGEVSLPS